ncbi:MAG: EAL domain-containing protein [Chloroflexi bacterium]|nr:EAL domain-containing protein [Chloroflexota bacterium]
MWSLLILSIDEDLREISLTKDVLTLGRGSNNDIVIKDDSASRHHAEIHYFKDDGRVKIIDLDTTNGTFVNGKRLHNHKYLEHEDQIRVGLQLITVVSQDSQSLDPSIIEPRDYTMTKELLIESVDHYAAFIHDIGVQLNAQSELKTALVDISTSIMHMVGAEMCQVFPLDSFEKLAKAEIPPQLAERVIEQKSAAIIPNLQSDSILKKFAKSKSHSLLLVPVMKDDEVLGLIYTEKTRPSATSFNQRDLRLVVALSHQISLFLQRKRTEEELEHNLNHDALTNLPNRNLFLDRLEKLIARTKRRTDYRFAVLFIDLDDFKIINDSLGHMVGDKVLIDVANRIGGILREEDTLARFGGDEFAILVDDIQDNEDILILTERIQNQLSDPFIVEGKSYHISASIGITLNDLEPSQPEEMLRNADIAMYRAKEHGKARFAVYDHAMHDAILERIQMQTQRRDAILKEELRLHYQPIISLETERVVGFEALLRWDSPDQGLVFPKKFFTTKDTTGLLNQINHWVLQTACQQMADWLQQTALDQSLHIAVNLSDKQINHPNLFDQITDTLKKTGLHAKNLWLEITENASIENSQITLELFTNLQRIGVNLSLDDFGTGLSSLSYLHKFPISAIKIDHSFISKIGEGDDGSKIVKTIVNLANSLGVISIAEGVETREQLEFLKSINCVWVQGFLISKALNPKDVPDFLLKDHYL